MAALQNDRPMQTLGLGPSGRSAFPCPFILCASLASCVLSGENLWAQLACRELLQGEDEPADGAEGASGIVGKPPAGDEDAGPAGAPGHDPRADHGQPRTGDDQPRHDQEESKEVGLYLAAGALGMSDADEVGDEQARR